MQIIKDIEQGSQEWLSLRLGIATASNFNKIITSTGKESSQLNQYAFYLASDYFLTEPERTFFLSITFRKFLKSLKSIAW